MPFAVFRRHQKKLLAVLAIFAMIAFTLDFSLFRNRFGSRAADDPIVAELKGETLYRSDLAGMVNQRARANRFMEQLTGRPEYFGPLKQRAVIDAIILEREADRLKMPATVDLAQRFLRRETRGLITTELFNRIYRNSFADEVTEEQLLADVANQVRLNDVQGLPGPPEITPLDLFQAYRDQYELVSAHAVPFYVEDYVKKVSDPSDAELGKYFDRYKDTLPSPESDTPGFKVPHRVQVELVSIDARALADEIKAKLTEKELRETYEQRSAEFPRSTPELPVNLFAGDSKSALTPRLGDAFLEVRSVVESRLADEKAQNEVSQKFGQIRDEAMASFYDKYDAVSEANKEAKEQGRKESPLPEPGDLLKAAAGKLHMKYERTPVMDRQDAEHYPGIGSARQGTGQSSGDKTFAQVFFDSKVFDAFELVDDRDGIRYLAWKTHDSPARVPSFEEARPKVVAAWKSEKARSLAESDARSFAERVREAKGDLKKVAGTRVVTTTLPVAKMQPDVLLATFNRSLGPQPTAIPQLPHAGTDLREAFFSLGENEVKVAPNEPKTIYYVLGLNQRQRADFAKLFAPYGPQMMLMSEVMYRARLRRAEEWMIELRRRAGLKDGWVPPDEAKTLARNENES
jgi:peptidyl-prolyl cis-trans isomerase D